MGIGALINRSLVNVNVTTTNEAGQVLGADVYTVTDGLIPSWAAQPYRGAMNLPGAWRAAIIAADLLGSLPWEAYDRGPLGVPVLAPDQPAVLTQPAPPDAGVTTVSSFMLDYIWHGNAVALKGPLTPEGDVSVLAPVPIGNVAIGRSNGRDLDGFRRGEVAYRIGNGVYHADEVWHLKGPCEPGALRGLGALEVHLTGALRTGLELQRQAGQLDIAGVPTGTLKVNAPDLTEDEAAVIRANWLAAQRNRTIAVLNDITEFEPLAWNPTEAQLLEARRFSLHETALIVGVPLYFLGVPAGSETYSNVEQEGIVLTRYHVNGGIRRMEAAFTGCMRPGRKVLADISDALRADTLTRYQAWQVGLTSRFLTPNEVRQREGLAPIPGGDELAPDPTQTPQTAAKPDTGPTEMAEGEKQQGRSLDHPADDLGDDLGPAEFAAVLGVWLAQESRARGGGDVDGSNLKEYWTAGKGRARWNTWTELYGFLVKYLTPDRAKRTAAQWFRDVKGYWPGDRRNRSAVDQAEALHWRGRHSFNPDQPRDPDGKWGNGGGGTSVATLLAANTGGGVAASGGRRRRPEPAPAGPGPQLTNDGMAIDYRATLEAATPDQRRALDGYVGDDFEGINAWLRGTGPDRRSPLTGALPSEAVAELDGLFSAYRTPGPVVGVRALSGDPAIPPPGQAVGKVIASAGLQSISMTTTAKSVDEVSSADVGRNYRSKPIRMRMTIPPGMPAIVAQGTTNAVASEREIILPHNTRYAITADENEGEIRWLTVTAMPPR